MTNQKTQQMIRDLSEYINKNGLDNDCNTPDYIIAEYMVNAYKSFVETVQSRDTWFGFKPWAKELTISQDKSVLINANKEAEKNE